MVKIINILRFLRKDIAIDSSYNLKHQEYSGTFSIVYEDDPEILNFIIGQNINSDAEIVRRFMIMKLIL